MSTNSVPPAYFVLIDLKNKYMVGEPSATAAYAPDISNMCNNSTTGRTFLATIISRAYVYQSFFSLNAGNAGNGIKVYDYTGTLKGTLVTGSFVRIDQDDTSVSPAYYLRNVPKIWYLVEP